MKIKKEINNLIIQEILQDTTYAHITSLNNPEVVEKLLEEYAIRYSKDLKEQYSLRDKLFINYLKSAHERNKNTNFFERILLKRSNLNGEVVEFLLSQELDFNYSGTDMFGTPWNLKDYLALNTKNPKIMNIVLEKLESLDQIYYGNPHYEAYTDLCLMNVISGNLAKAESIFNDNRYQLFRELDEETLKKLRKENTNLYSSEISENTDTLYQILMTTKNSTQINENDKKAFLNKILYSEKIKIFNIENLHIIKFILDEEDYNRFISYLSYMLESNEISLYSTKKNERYTLKNTLR